MPKTTGLPIAALLLASTAAAAPVERRLHPSKIEASSFLWNSWNRFQENYHPNYIADDDPRTAWVEGAEGFGVDEWVRMSFSRLDDATQLRLRVRNGYHKTKRLYKMNARIKDLSVMLLPGGKRQSFTLSDAQTWQDVRVKQPEGRLTAVEVRVKSVYPGSKWEDLCVSDLQVFVTAETPENPALEKARYHRILTWKKDRLEMKALFESERGKGLPLLPQYWVASFRRLKHVGSPVQRAQNAVRKWHQASLALARTIETEMASHWRPVTLEFKTKQKIPEVDGLVFKDAGSEFYEDEGFYDDYISVEDLYDDLIDDSAAADQCADGCQRPACWDACAEDGACESKCEAIEEACVDRCVRKEARLQFNGIGVLMPTNRRAGIFHVDDFAVFARKDTKERCGGRQRVYAWARLKKTPEGREVVEALKLKSCGYFETRGGGSRHSYEQTLVYNADGFLELIGDGEQVSLYQWGKRRGQPVLKRGKSIVADGVTLTRGES